MVYFNLVYMLIYLLSCNLLSLRIAAVSVCFAFRIYINTTLGIRCIFSVPQFVVAEVISL